MGIVLELVAAADGETVKPSGREMDRLNLLEKRSAEGEAEVKIEEGN